MAPFRGYRRAWLAGDLLAGVTVAAYLVPQVMAYAQLAGLRPVAGLWAAVPALTAYAFLGSSRQLSVGPESTTALMTATVVGPLAHGDATRYAVLSAGLAMVVGGLAVLAWLLRLGFVADLLSQPILVGYLAGVAVIMIIGQLGRVTGVRITGESLLEELASFVRNAGQIHLPTFTMATVGLIFLFGMRRALPRVPGPLLAVVLGAVVVAAFHLEDHGLKVVGPVPSGLPDGQLPPLSDLHLLLLPAAGLLVVGFTDNVLTARAFAARERDDVDATRELLALGVANLGSGIVQGFPVSSSGSRTALGVASGSRTQVHSLTAAALVVVVVLAAGPALASFPTAMLGAIVVYAATRLVDVAGIRRLATFRRSEFMLAGAAFAGVLVFDILYGVLVAIGVSVIELLARVARPHDAVLGFVPGLAGMHDVDDYPEARTLPGLLVYRYDSPLFFANAQNFRHRALAAVDHMPGGVQWFVLNAEANVEVDITGLDAVEALREELQERGIVFAMARVKQELLADLTAYGLVDAVGRDRLFPTLPTAVAAYRAWAALSGAPAEEESPRNPG